MAACSGNVCDEFVCFELFLRCEKKKTENMLVLSVFLGAKTKTNKIKGF